MSPQARFLPKLMIVLDAIMGSMSSSFYVVLCLLMVMYIYAITGIAFFRQNGARALQLPRANAAEPDQPFV